MRARPVRRSAVAVAIALGALGMSGCASIFERTEPAMTSSTENKQEPEIAAAVEASSANIVSARAEHSRSGLGVNLYVTFYLSTDIVTAPELEAVLRAVAAHLPEGMGVVRFTARDASEDRVPLNDAGEQLGLPDLSVKSEGVIVMSPATLADLYAE